MKSRKYSRKKSGTSRVAEAASTEYGGEATRKKNLRLHQSKIERAMKILGTETETETIEAALDLVVFRQELLEGVRAMRGARLADLFSGA
ncbi:MAG: hypothetical protein ACREMA_05805 [Longimicrobiales bacterium]